MEFTKVNALGNDFILLDHTQDITKESYSLKPQIVRTLCERSYGIGADGILLVQRRTNGYQMVIYNADGTRAEMCGNGLRCVALYLQRRGAFLTNKDIIITDAGEQRLTFSQDSSRNEELVEVELPIPTWGKLLKFPEGILYQLDLGNPHVILIDDQKYDQRIELVDTIKSRLQVDVNLSFVYILYYCNGLDYRYILLVKLPSLVALGMDFRR